MKFEQAYINGFVKRANEYGFNEAEAFNILKQSSVFDGGAEQALSQIGSTAGKYTGGTLGGLGGLALGGILNVPKLKGTGRMISDLLDGVSLVGGASLGADTGQSVGNNLGGLAGKLMDKGTAAAGNFVAEHPEIEQGLEKYLALHNNALETLKGGLSRFSELNPFGTN